MQLFPGADDPELAARYGAQIAAIPDTERPARLVGHSMGANIAAIYASARPQRVSQVVMLDFLGLMATESKDAPQQLGKWLDHLHDAPELRAYPDHAALQRRMQSVNPRLTPERTAFLVWELELPNTVPEG